MENKTFITIDGQVYANVEHLEFAFKNWSEHLETFATNLGYKKDSQFAIVSKARCLLLASFAAGFKSAIEPWFEF